MKRILSTLILAWAAIPLFLQAQDIVKIEYFFDTDPGFGSGVNVPVTAAPDISNFTFPADISALPSGFHMFYVRSRDADGRWSETANRILYKAPPPPSSNPLPDMVEAEYFYDTDPGFGNGTSVSLPAGTNVSGFAFMADISALPFGFHLFYVRTRDADGRWSETAYRILYKAPPPPSSNPLPNMVAAEYFFDTDPGYGNGTNLTLPAGTNVSGFAFMADISALPSGFHMFYVRTRDADGRWSETANRILYKAPPPTANPLPDIVEIEYFLDTDPGFGNGTSVSPPPGTNIQNYLIPVCMYGVTVGSHKLYIRSRDANGKWSETATLDFQNNGGQTFTTFYADTDGDGYGDISNTTVYCTAPAGYVSNSDDCDDTMNTVYPGATEVCNEIDDDCDTQIDEGVTITFYTDADGDGFGDPNAPTVQACTVPAGYSAVNTDCDDNAALVYPGATEVCNLVDDDCDTQIDEGVTTTFYTDADSDGFGDPNAPTVQACTVPAGYSAVNTDCDDGAPLVYPGAPEACNLVDDDCDTQIDEGVTTTFYTDADSDGFGDPNAPTVQACTVPAGYSADNTDCDDTAQSVYPGATEVCNLIDDDCDTQIDEGVTITFYADTDGDGFGDPGATVQACSAPTGYVTDNTDCDDNASLVFPGAAETCNEIDDDCDGQVDEGFTTTFFADTDGDGFGDPNASIQACSAPNGYVADNADCDDNAALVYPGAAETCNDTDDDCDSQVDEGVTITYYADVDGDGYGNPYSTIQACSAPAGYVLDNTDCYDYASVIHPGAPEICDNLIDDDCDFAIDEKLITWTGNGDGISWMDNANWDNGLVPQPCNDVVIPMGSNVVVPDFSNVFGRTLQIDETATFTIDTTSTMTIQN